MSTVITLETDSNNIKPVRIVIGGRGAGVGDYETQQWIYSIKSFVSNRPGDAKRQVTLPTSLNVSTCTLTPGVVEQEGVTNELLDWQQTAEDYFSTPALGLSSIVGMLNRSDHALMSVSRLCSYSPMFRIYHNRHT